VRKVNRHVLIGLAKSAPLVAFAATTLTAIYWSIGSSVAGGLFAASIYPIILCGLVLIAFAIFVAVASFSSLPTVVSMTVSWVATTVVVSLVAWAKFPVWLVYSDALVVWLSVITGAWFVTGSWLAKRAARASQAR
jgi:hypothetical protein